VSVSDIYPRAGVCVSVSDIYPRAGVCVSVSDVYPRAGVCVSVSDVYPRAGVCVSVQEVIRVSREFKCCAGCNCCAGSDMCAMEIQVEAPVGQVIGYVKQQSVVATFSSAHGGHTLLKVKSQT